VGRASITEGNNEWVGNSGGPIQVARLQQDDIFFARKAGSVPALDLGLFIMKEPSLFIVPISILGLISSGCGTPHPSPEAQTREWERQRQIAEKQANFFNENSPPDQQPTPGQRR
jgi:hypothetical protein